MIPMDALTPVEITIRAFGSGRKLALALGLDPRYVYRWRAPADKRGGGGQIPQRFHRKVLELARSRRLDLTAEDLILLKMAFHREKDLHDIRGILAIQKGKLDLTYLRDWAGKMLPDDQQAELQRWVDHYSK